MLAGAVIVCTTQPAFAETICARDAVRTFNDVHIFSREFTASCRPGAECRITTHHRDDSATFGFSHSMSFERAGTEAAWRMVLVDEVDTLDVTQAASVRIDDNAAITVAAGAITTGEPDRRFIIAETVSAQVLDEAKPGTLMAIAYKTPAGEDRSATFSLIGLSDALAWTDCAQGELKSGKADAAVLNASEPEFSGPEPGVPIDPDGRETGEPDG
jgi:hypothetical protein